MSEKPRDEIWKPVLNFEGLYEVSNIGRVRSIMFRNRHCVKRQLKLMKLTKSKWGYIRTTISKNGISKGKFVHVLVAEAFLGKCPKGLECAHLNGIRHDNRIENLKWVTRKENCSHKILHGTWQGGENCGKSKLKEKDIKEIRRLRKEGMEMIEIGKRVNTTMSNVSAILRGKSWKHV